MAIVPKRLIGELSFDVYSDTAVTNNPKKIAFSDKRKVDNDALSDFISWDRELAASSITTVSFGFTATYLFLFSDGDVTIKLNAGSQVFTVHGFWAGNLDVTSIEITNVSAVDEVNVKLGYGA